MDRENVGYIHNGVLLNHKEKWNYVSCREVDGTEEHHVKQNKLDAERKVLHILSYMLYLDLKREKKEYKSRKGTIWEKEGDLWEAREVKR
jgi:hypothetical protein